MSDWYKLDGNHVPVLCNLLEGVRAFENDDRGVDLTILKGCKVSTVFLGFDHNFTTSGPPVLFETLVFGGPLEGDEVRYCTWDEAVQGHAKVVESVLAANAKGAGDE